jgi:hypothetical protein
MPQVLFRPIKAKIPDWQAFNREVSKTIDNTVKPDLLEYFNKVVKSWRNPPTFQARKSVKPTSITLEVKPTGPNAEIWKYVSFGTRPHIIVPKRAKALRFQWGGYGSYKPRTTTSGGYNGPGKVVGGKQVFRQQVKHPGNKARNFEKHIARWYKTRFQRVMNEAVKRGVKAAKQAEK